MQQNETPGRRLAWPRNQASFASQIRDRQLGRPRHANLPRNTIGFSWMGNRSNRASDCADLKSATLWPRSGKIAVVSDNQKHNQMRVFEAFEVAEEIAISRYETRISARIRMVCRRAGEELAIRR